MKKETITNLLLILIVGIVGGLIASYAYSSFNSKFYSPVSINKIEEKTYIQENVALEQGIETAKDSLIFIKANNQVFTGIVITNDGLIAVLDPDLQSTDQLFISSDEATLYNIVKKDSSSGIVIIKVKNNQLKPVEFFDFEKIKAGKKIYSLSVFNNGSGGVYYSANEGIIKNIEEPIKTTIVEEGNIFGSPIFDVENRLIGVASKDKNNNVIIIPSSKIRTLAGLD